VRRRLRISVEVGYRRASQNAGAVAFPASTHNREKPRRTLFFAPVYAAERLTKTAAKAYISFLRRAAAWRDGASTKPLTVHTVTEHRAMLVAMFASPRRRCGLLRLRSGLFFLAIF
jgi:hypothetical protein